MKLVEHRGKELLETAGIRIPPGIVTNNNSYINLSYHKAKYREFFLDHQGVIIKAQIPYGYRAKHGLIKASENYTDSLKIIDEMYNKEFMGQPISTLLIEKKLNVKSEYYVSITYDTKSRNPMILFSRDGGIDIEDVLKNKEPVKYIVSIIDGLSDFETREIVKQAGFVGKDIFLLSNFIKNAYDCFIRYDCKALEINPIIETHSGQLYAGDAKITIDDNAVQRHDIFYDITEIEDRSLLTERELEARKIDLHDHRGVAGKTFIDMDGDIAILASGGGASLTCMDALLVADGKPANYTEYSGNPPRSKVRRLTEITLSNPNLNGCLIIGGTANFTDVYETLGGFVEGLLDLPHLPKYPIVVRRAGQRSKEAFEMLREFAEQHKLNIELYGEETPMTQAVKRMIEKVEEYKNGNSN